VKPLADPATGVLLGTVKAVRKDGVRGDANVYGVATKRIAETAEEVKPAPRRRKATA
jgi:hypothetical protein